MTQKKNKKSTSKITIGTAKLHLLVKSSTIKGTEALKIIKNKWIKKIQVEDLRKSSNHFFLLTTSSTLVIYLTLELTCL